MARDRDYFRGENSTRLTVHIKLTWQICWANIRHCGTPSLRLGRYSRRLPRGRYSIMSCTTCSPVNGQRNGAFILLFPLLFKDKNYLMHVLWCLACCVLKAPNIDIQWKRVLHFELIFNIYRRTAGIKNQFLESSTKHCELKERIEQALLCTHRHCDLYFNKHFF